MKYHTLAFAPVIGAALLACACPAPATIIGVEPFVYADGPIAGQSGGTFWDWQNIVPANHTGTNSDWNNVSGTPAVASGRLVTDNNSARREYNGANEFNGAVNEDNIHKQVYYRVTLSTGATLPSFAGMSSYEFGVERVFFGKRFGEPNFGIEVPGGLATNSTTPVATNTTYTLVARLDFDDNLVRLYVNPDLSQEEPSTAAVSASYTDTFSSTAVRLASGAGGAVTWDDLVVASSWDNLRTLVTAIADEDDGSLGGGSGVSLREALNYSPSGSFITFAPALSGATITLTNGQLLLNKNLTIDGSTLPSGIQINGNAASRVFYVTNGVVAVLKSLTIANGLAPAGNFSANGGGGGIFCRGRVDLLNCSLVANTVSLGNSYAGGIACDEGGEVRLTACTLTGNSAAASGGAIYNNLGTVTLTNCTLANNSADSGGAIFADTGFAITSSGTTLTHCTLALNHSTGTPPGSDGGGAIDNLSGTLTLTACILAGNTAVTGTGPDLWMEGDALTATNCLIGDGADSTLVNGVNGNLVGTGGSPINALLAPLGNYGGSTQTVPPLPASPAIDAASVIAGLTTDQRGSARNVGAGPDIGAVESGGLWVQNNNNSGTNSLRDVIANSASVTSSKTVLFTTNLSGATITLTNEIVLSNNVAIDASSLPGGLTLNGGNATAIFYVRIGQTVSLHGLTITGGNGAGGDFTFSGGAIENYGNLSITRCTLSGNFATDGGGGGGAIRHTSGVLTLTDCTLSSNSANFGGAIASGGGTLTLTHCTLALNHSTGTTPASDGGGAIDIYNGGTLTLTACILAGNTAATGTGPELWMETGSLAATNCLVGNGTNSTLVNGVNGNLVGTGASPINALLAPLGNYGGSTKTMPPLPGSPAINAAGATTFATDQRGYPRPVGLAADIGAVEGIYNAAGPGNITSITRLTNGSVRFSFTNLTDASFPVVATTNLNQPSSNWTQIGFATETSPGIGLIQFTDPQAATFPQRFYRVKSP
jgi:hypothetical protein